MAQDKSSSNSNVRRCGQAGEGEDVHLSLNDIIDETDRLEADADAVLGGSDAYNCTYPQGYVKRQAMYACITCTPEGNAGICLACSYACHEGHDLLELYTKRHFKCDCGNEKFKGKTCQLFKEKKELNSRNRYNQNFRGLYCTCSRPYPDEEDSVEDEMIQCIICEDWYHGRHLGAQVPDSSDYHEMICPGCMCKYSFLWAYHLQAALTTAIKSDKAGEEADVNIEATTSGLCNSKPNTGVNEPTQSDDLSDLGGTCVKSEANASSTSNDDSNLTKRKLASQNGIALETPASKKRKTEDSIMLVAKKQENGESSGSEEDHCLLEALQQRVVDHPDCGAFWTENWRSKLCRCSHCMEMYRDRNIEFLIDAEDTMQAYEEKGAESQRNRAADEEAQAEAFNSMGRVQQIEIVQGVMDFKSELNEFLKGFAEEGKVVTESDVREFFERMHERRRNRTQLPQHSCR